jgi:hypothetical protein
MNGYRIGLRLLALLITFIVAACGTVVAPTVAPTENPLPLSYTSVNGALTVNYPRGWVAEEQAGLVALASDDAAMREVVAQSALGAGQVGLIITPFSADTLALIGPANGVPNTTVLEFARVVGSLVLTGTPSEPTEITINGRDAAYMTLTLGGNDSIAVVVEAGGGAMAVVQAATASGELEQFQDTILAIAGTVTFTPVTTPTPATP